MATPRRSCTVAAILFCVTVLRGAATALECYSCSGEDCAKVATAGYTIACTNSDDVCYSRFDATTRKIIY
uniref:Putative secreted peptide n=1 Tax=Anopheles braziliensis TaxID=58242 RepID=A0A2M3ZXC7_9DIPT